MGLPTKTKRRSIKTAIIQCSDDNNNWKDVQKITTNFTKDNYKNYNEFKINQQYNGALLPIELQLSVVQNEKDLQGCLVGFVHLVVVLNLPLIINCSLRLLS